MDPTYIPLVAAGISALGVVVGALVLRHQLRSQVNPFALEFYKRRCDAFANINLVLMGYWTVVNRCVHDPSDVHLAEFHKHYSDLRNSINTHLLWLPPNLLGELDELFDRMTEFRIAVSKEDTKSVMGKLSDVRIATNMIHKTFIRNLHSPQLGEAVKQISDKVPLVQSPVLPSDITN